MSGTKTCPLCGIARWNSDGCIVIDGEQINSLHVAGSIVKQILDAIRFAESHGWKAGKA